MNKQYLFLLKTKPYKCEKCGISSWQNEAITLEIHHIDGNHLNNELNNLQLLCPNCHSQTKNYCKTKVNKKISDEEIILLVEHSNSIRELLLKAGLSTSGANYNRIRNILSKNNITKFNKNFKENFCIDCGQPIYINATRCVECNKKYQQLQSQIIDRNLLKQKIRKQPFTQIGAEYLVSDNTIRKWCKKYNLPSTKKEINSYSDTDWELI